MLKPIYDNAETLAGAGTDVRRRSDALAPRKNLQGKMAEAEAMYLRALQGYENAVGADHPRTRVIARNLNALQTSS
jgi:hypothetical protein